MQRVAWLATACVCVLVGTAAAPKTTAHASSGYSCGSDVDAYADPYQDNTIQFQSSTECNYPVVFDFAQLILYDRTTGSYQYDDQDCTGQETAHCTNQGTDYSAVSGDVYQAVYKVEVHIPDGEGWDDIASECSYVGNGSEIYCEFYSDQGTYYPNESTPAGPDLVQVCPPTLQSVPAGMAVGDCVEEAITRSPWGAVFFMAFASGVQPPGHIPTQVSGAQLSF